MVMCMEYALVHQYVCYLFNPTPQPLAALNPRLEDADLDKLNEGYKLSYLVSKLAIILLSRQVGMQY